VYDTIKVVDSQTAVGVMHFGTFPSGWEVATFVLARHNYPFAKMAVPDHELLFSHELASVPTTDLLANSKWDGHLIFLQTPDTSLLNQLNPIVFQVDFQGRGQEIQAQCRAGGMEFQRSLDAVTLPAELRMIGPGTLLGRWPAEILPVDLFPAVAAPLTVNFVLKRVRE